MARKQSLYMFSIKGTFPTRYFVRLFEPADVGVTDTGLSAVPVWKPEVKLGMLFLPGRKGWVVILTQ